MTRSELFELDGINYCCVIEELANGSIRYRMVGGPNNMHPRSNGGYLFKFKDDEHLSPARLLREAPDD